MHGKYAGRSMGKTIAPWIFIAPHLILFAIFFLVPALYGIFTSFTKWNIFSAPAWVGLNNYRTILFDSASTFYKQFWNGLRNTSYFVLICVPLQVVLPLLVALALSARPKGFRVFQSIFYLPTLLSITTVTLTWYFMFNRSLGLVNNLFHIDVNWYAAQPYAWITLVIVTLWWIIGVNMIIFIAALSGVDPSILESADLDGADGLRKFWYITLPSIKFQLVYALVTSVISEFNIYGQPLILTVGGPNESTYVLLMYIRNLAFGIGNPIAGMASAMAVCLGFVIGVVSIIQIRMINRNAA
jgi:ABC-type sugar transport systems, permease components